MSRKRLDQPLVLFYEERMENTPPSASPPQPTSVGTAEDKTIAIVSYLTLLGFLIALIMYSSNKTVLGAFHLRQCLGLILAGIGGWIGIIIVNLILVFIPVIGPIVALLLFWCFGLTMVVFWIIGLLAAINGECKPVPLVGEQFQKWFAGAFK